MVTIKQLLIWLTAFGLGLAALLSPTPMVAAGAYSLALTALAAKAILAVTTHIPNRAYHLGFVVVFSIYLYTANPANSRGYAGSNMELLLTQQVFEILEPYFVPHERALAGMFGGGPGVNQPSPPKVYRTDDLIVVWHSLWAIIFGECGGMAAYILKGRTDRKS